MSYVTGISNLILAGASGYSLYRIVPTENPYAFTACAIGFCHGLINFVNDISDNRADVGEDARNISREIMELVPLPLTNIELYNLSKNCNCLGLAHGFFVIPLVLYLGKNLVSKDEGADENMDTLKHMTILGNIVSLLFLSVNEDNCLYCLMAMLAFTAQYGSKYIESQFEGWGECVFAMGYAAFNFLTGHIVGTR